MKQWKKWNKWNKWKNPCLRVKCERYKQLKSEVLLEPQNLVIWGRRMRSKTRNLVVVWLSLLPGSWGQSIKRTIQLSDQLLTFDVRRSHLGFDLWAVKSLKNGFWGLTSGPWNPKKWKSEKVNKWKSDNMKEWKVK